MNLTIQLTDEQAKQLAVQIKAGVPTTAPALPEPPEGFHPAMMGPLKVMAKGDQCSNVGSWLDGKFTTGWSGSDAGEPYAIRIGSEIARMNGLEPEAIPADKPERKAREFYLFPSEPSLGHYPVRQVRMDKLEQVRVREILPGEPTQEQVQALVDAIEEQLGYIHSHHILPAMESALTPFRKP